MQRLFILDLRQMGVRYKQDVDSHSVTLNCIMGDGLEKQVRYKQEMRLLMREYGKSTDLKVCLSVVIYCSSFSTTIKNLMRPSVLRFNIGYVYTEKLAFNLWGLLLPPIR